MQEQHLCIKVLNFLYIALLFYLIGGLLMENESQISKLITYSLAISYYKNSEVIWNKQAYLGFYFDRKSTLCYVLGGVLEFFKCVTLIFRTPIITIQFYCIFIIKYFPKIRTHILYWFPTLFYWGIITFPPCIWFISYETFLYINRSKICTYMVLF